MYTFLNKHPYPASPAKVIHVKGSDYEMGRSHAEQTADCIGKGMAKFYCDFWKRALSQAPQGRLEALAFAAISRLIDPLLVNKLKSQVPDNVLERIRGVADASGQSYDDLMISVVLPDLLPLLEVYMARLRPNTVIEVLEPPRFGCTSFVQSGDKFFYGRNLDFPGVAYWDRYPVIQVTEPTKSLRYIGFASAGVPIAGITGINEAQISIALHQHYCAASNLKGTLPFIIAEDVLRSATSLNAAIDIIRSSKVATSWAFVITDGKAKEAAIVENTPRAMGIRRLSTEDPVLAHSNYFLTAECQASEFATTARMNWDNHSRQNRLERLVSAYQGKMTAAQGVKCLSDHFDPYWGEEKIINRTISQVYNIQSLLLDPSEMKAYFAEGDAPIQIRDYHEFDLGELFAGRGGRTGTILPGYRFSDEKKVASKTAFILSFIAAFDGKLDEAGKWLDEMSKIEFVPEAALVSGVIRLKNGDYEGGRELLAKAKAFIEEKAAAKGLAALPPEYFETCIFLARSYDLLGKRAEAKAVYKALAERPDLEDSNIRKIAQKAGPYPAKRLSRIMMPYSSYIPFE